MCQNKLFIRDLFGMDIDKIQLHSSQFLQMVVTTLQPVSHTRFNRWPWSFNKLTNIH